jgi:hypothetical protein
MSPKPNIYLRIGITIAPSLIGLAILLRILSSTVLRFLRTTAIAPTTNTLADSPNIANAFREIAYIFRDFATTTLLGRVRYPGFIKLGLSIICRLVYVVLEVHITQIIVHHPRFVKYKTRRARS